MSHPDHIDDQGWEAIEVARDRLSAAWNIEDYSEVIGKAKDLVETLAKVVIASSDGTVNDKTEVIPVIKMAMKSLGRQPGTDLSQDQEVRAIAQAAQTIATSIAPIRNTYGTGHGRAQNPKVVEELASMTLESALMWSRWALRRLGHLLADYPNDLIDAVQGGTTRHTLRQKFKDAARAQQRAEVQHRIGVAFGQQSAGGFGNATEVGVDPAVDGGFGDYPMDYRRGLLQGMLLTGGGEIGLTDFYAKRFVSLLASVPDEDARDLLADLRQQVVGAAWIERWRGSAAGEPFESFCEDLLNRTDWRPSSED